MKIRSWQYWLVLGLVLLQAACNTGTFEPIVLDNNNSHSPSLAPQAHTTAKPDQTQTMLLNDASLLSLQTQIDELTQAVNQLQNQALRLEKDLVSTQQSIGILANQKTSSTNNNSDATGQSAYQRALQAYKLKQYTQTVQLLSPYSQNYNQPNARFLMIQAHSQLQNCDTVINLGKSFQKNLPQHAKAADALLLVANCQYQMQQKDIARDTWRYIIQAYPNSVAAGLARIKLKT